MPSYEKIDIITIAIFIPVASGKWHGQIINDSNIYICSTPLEKASVSYITNSMLSYSMRRSISSLGLRSCPVFARWKERLTDLQLSGCLLKWRRPVSTISPRTRYQLFVEGYYRMCHLCHFQAVSVEMREMDVWGMALWGSLSGSWCRQ